MISVLKCVNNNYELFYCCSCSRPFTLHCSYFIRAAILRRTGDCCGREKLALLQLPVLVKYRIALVGVPVASDSRILSPSPTPTLLLLSLLPPTLTLLSSTTLPRVVALSNDFHGTFSLSRFALYVCVCLGLLFRLPQLHWKLVVSSPFLSLI